MARPPPPRGGRRRQVRSTVRLTLLVKDNDVAASEVDGVRSAEAGQTTANDDYPLRHGCECVCKISKEGDVTWKLMEGVFDGEKRRRGREEGERRRSLWSLS